MDEQMGPMVPTGTGEQEPMAENAKEKKPLSAEEEKKIIDTIFEEKKNYEQSTLEKRQEYVDIYNAFIGKMENVERTPYNSDENIPKMRTEIAYIVPYIFSGEPEFEVSGVGDEDAFGAKIFEKILNFRLENIENAYDKIESWVKQSVSIGTSFIHPFWKTEIKEGVVVKDEPDLQVHNQMDIFYNPTIQNSDEQPSFIVRSQLTKVQIKNNPAYNENKEKVEGRGSHITGNFDSSRLISSDYPSKTPENSGLIDVYERYTPGRIQTVVDGAEQLLLRDVETPRQSYDFVKFVFELNMIPNRSDGFGVGQNTIAISKLYHKMFNQQLMNVKLINNPMFYVNKSAKIDKRQLVGKPGGAIEVNDVNNDIKQVQFIDLKMGASSFINKIEEEHQRASGASDLVQGGASNKTLGQDQLAQQNSSNRFEIIQRRFRKAFSLLGKKLIELELENLQDENSSILRIFPEELRGEVFAFLVSEEAKNLQYNVKIRGNTTVSRNKDLESKRLVDVYNLASAPNSPVQLSTKEARAFLRRIAERQGEQGIDEIIGAEAPMQPMQGMPGMMPEMMQDPNAMEAVPGMTPPPGAIEGQQGMNQELSPQ